MAVDPEDIELEDLARLNEIENAVLVFAVATYGEGDPTDNLQTTFVLGSLDVLLYWEKKATRYSFSSS